jgi:hypothetical protein
VFAQKVVAPVLVDTVGVGGIHSSTTTGADVPEQPLALVTVAVNVPEDVIKFVCVFLPLDQL